MKQTLAILALITIVMGWPVLAASAGPAAGDEPMQAPPGHLSLGDPDRDVDRGEDEVEFEQHGDPHDLGGGFRGSGTPAGAGGGAPIWITPVAQLIMQLL